MTKTVDILDAQNDLQELVDFAHAGNDVLISKNNAPVARLSGLPAGQPASKRIPGLHRGAIWTSEDFDAPLDEAFWLNGK